MTAMDIIGIILASAVALCWLMGGAEALLEERFKLKEAFAKQNRELFRNTMDDTTELVPSEDEEP